MIVIIDYDAGNPAAVKNMLKKAGTPSVITQNPDEIRKADKLILPGVGNFEYGMAKLKKFGLLEVIAEKALQDKVPFLGICLGMQLMTRHSEEGDVDGLGWIDAQTLKFRFQNNSLKIPHMSWTGSSFIKRSIFKDFNDDARFYFVHSYYVKCNEPGESVGKAFYGIEFDCAFCKDNLFGVQFHPEKSHRFGMQLLKNFAAL